MRVFLSWPEKHSKTIAKELKIMLGKIFENEIFDVFMSEEDISSGSL